MPTTRCISLSKPSCFFGFILCILTCFIFSYYMYILHETRLWFSNIRQVEREISFRTESGLYYSYYKQILQEKTWKDVWNNLLSDKLTEAPSSINLLERMNIYQELFLALIYMFINNFYQIQNILFYTYSCFIFSGLNLSSIFLLSWKLSGSIILSLLPICWAFTDIDDFTRVFFTVNLRENFALPFFWFHNLFIVHHLLKSDDNSNNRSLKFSLILPMFLFSLFWQFNQFILLLQSVSLLGITFVFSEKTSTVISIFIHEIIAFILLLISQFFQSMLISSVFIWFNIASIIVLTLIPPNNNWKKSILIVGIILALTFLTSSLIKMLLHIESDTHIWTFVKAKLNLPLNDIPFETALYICHGAFAFIDMGFFDRTSKYGMFPIYCISLVIILGLSIYKVFFSKEILVGNSNKHGLKKSNKKDDIITEKNTREDIINPGLLFLSIQSILIGIMACLTLRMKYVWFPLISVISANSFKFIDKWVTKYPKYAVIIGMCYLMINNQYAIYKQQIANEQEFYDPDTVELMEWIETKTPPSSIFAGSMQLMAGVKACTSRRISNHPHFEDKKLREKTELIYKIYGKYHLVDVRDTLCNESINYIILEDSICLSNQKDGCSTNEIMDKIQIKNKKENISSERFCSAVKNQDSNEITKYFKMVFFNRTFRVYQIQCKREF